MPHVDLYIARKYCQEMRDLIVHHAGGWADAASLSKFQQVTAAAASAVDDLECRHLASAIAEFAGDLFSVIDHAKWAQGRTSGADVLRLRILREITAFQGRLTYIEAVRTGAGQDSHLGDAHPSKAR
jgi:hypothetical protein